MNITSFSKFLNENEKREERHKAKKMHPRYPTQSGKFALNRKSSVNNDKKIIWGEKRRLNQGNGLFSQSIDNAIHMKVINTKQIMTRSKTG